MEKHNIISDWLDKHGDPMIYEKVEKELERINKMLKEFVTYSQALRLKELGFDEPCFGWYKIPNKRLCGEYEMITFQNNYPHIEFVDAPTVSQAFRWFREKGRDIKIQKEPDGLYWGFFYWDGAYWLTIEADTYEEVESACLDKLLELSEGTKTK